MNADAFPPRYEPVDRLGRGGGGEVWVARDRTTGRTCALKLLPQASDEPAMMALVREATMLSGIEGLGVPRVLHFGRMPDGRAYLVRELVEGQSLDQVIERGIGVEAVPCALGAVAQAAERVTKLHQALLFHGDLKPANIIVGPDGTATLVDLGLAAPWQERGTAPAGLTPRFAAPELLLGEPLSPQAEVYALAATLREVLAAVASHLEPSRRDAIARVVERGMRSASSERHPSADEFAQALRRAGTIEGHDDAGAKAWVWTIEGIEAVSADLVARIEALPAGAALVVTGPKGSGRSTLLRRAAWALGVAGRDVTLIDGDALDVDTALGIALEGREPKAAILVVDDVDERSDRARRRLETLRDAGAVVVVSATPHGAQCLRGPTFQVLDVPKLELEPASALVSRMIPSLRPELVRYIHRRAGGRPGAMRTIVEGLDGTPVLSVEDIERRLADVPVSTGVKVDPVEIHRLLDRGLFDQAADHLQAYDADAPSTVSIGLARAKLATGRAEPQTALRHLRAIEPRLDGEDPHARPVWHVEKARAHLRTGDYADAERHAALALTRLGGSVLGEVARGRGDVGAPADDGLTARVAEALAVSGLAQSLSGRHETATKTLVRSVEVARGAHDDRVLAVALGSLAFAQQRNDELDAAERSNREALDVAQRAGDAGHVATTRLNLAGIARMRGDIAAAIEHLEAAVDMGRRSGRQSTVRQALLNLANLDLYLGRLDRGRRSIETLAADRDGLGAVQRAQLLALEAEAAVLEGRDDEAAAHCAACAEAYTSLGRPVDAAEAMLERIALALEGPSPDLEALQETLFQAESCLGEGEAHRTLLLYARGRLAEGARDRDRARAAYDEAVDSAEASGQREWSWRVRAARAALRERHGDPAGAAVDREEALGLLKAGAERLPRDLREVYWSHPRRRAVRGRAEPTLAAVGVPPLPAVVGPAVVGPAVKGPPVMGPAALEPGAPTQLAPAEARQDRIARLLEINRVLAGEHDLDRLLEKVTDHAVALLYAERGFVLLRSASGEDHLSVHAARDRRGDDPHARFSHSIAERVVTEGEPFVAVDAPRDDRVSDYVSVHALMLRSVACVPIRTRTGSIGALYLETRLRSGSMFLEELATLAAFADQAAIAIESARLIQENRQRAEELERTNAELERARMQLEEALGQRTAQLEDTRRDLKATEAVLEGHFGYRDIVGTSSAMRRVYAVIERVKDADVPVLITGESGTGKEVVARAIHKGSGRGEQRFVGVNCGAIPEHLLESELFGHVRGAFTGADRDKRGLFRELDDGSILLDEIGEMPSKMQAGLLRVLQEKVVRPVGGTREEAVGTRVIAATHRDLAEMVARGHFREDLYYRLNVIEVRVPALRERREDIPLLIDHFLGLFAARYQRERRTVSRDALRRLMEYGWPGNVRQLENILLNAWILSDGPEIEAEDFELPPEGRRGGRDTGGAAPGRGGAPSLGGVRGHPPTGDESEVRPLPRNADDAQQQERDRILAALEATNWNRAKAAQRVGIPRRTFYRRLKKYGIQ
ncbi:MAG: sigma 54-interacting transcriptional regulator [Myxococcota bacterium]